VIWQFVDSATSVGANHRACRHARSDREFAAKIGIAVEEADESAFWLELITEVGRPVPIAVPGLREEAAALRAILSRSAATIRKRIKEARPSGTPYPRPK
jgi:four helix bundle protein